METKKIGFDKEKYIAMQKRKILERVRRFDNKLYIEFGGKLFDDYHATRVLPGFSVDTKIKVFESLKDKLEVIFCVSASDIENRRIRGDSGLTYDLEAMRCINEIRKSGLLVDNVVITLFEGQKKALDFANRLTSRGENVTMHGITKGYVDGNIDIVVSDEGLGTNPYIETNKPIVLINAPGAKSGKLGLTLCQLYHEYKKGVFAGYAKYETFPCWDLPLHHPVNVAFEAATADLEDEVMIDDFHFQKYGTEAVSYNRDMQAFPIVRDVLNKILKSQCYESPTDMGFSSVGACITDDILVREASKNEVLRRYYRYVSEAEKGLTPYDVAERVIEIAKKIDLIIDTDESSSHIEDFTSLDTKQSVHDLLEDFDEDNDIEM